MKRIKVLHVISRFEVGGIEKWLMDFHRIQFDRTAIDHNFLCVSGKKGFLDNEIDAPIYYEPNIKKGRISFLWSLFKFALRNKSEFDILHLHLYKFSSFIGFVFWLCGYRNIIAHAHSDKRFLVNDLVAHKRIKSIVYGASSKLFFYIAARSCIAASQGAAADVFGQICRAKTKIMCCGIEMKNVKDERVRKRYKVEFSCDDNTVPFVIVASLTLAKNHQFLINVFERIVQDNNQVKLFFVGEGPLREVIENSINSKGLDGKIVLLGNRTDILSILQNFSKAFVFPSLYEGLGLALVEAQFCGNYCFISDSIPNEAIVEPDLICRLPLQVDLWAKSIVENLEYLKSTVPAVRSKNHFSVDASAINFQNLYLSMLSQN